MLVTRLKVLLRYLLMEDTFTQAVDELDFNWILLKQGAKDEPNWKEWTIKQAVQLSLDSGSTVRIGVDPTLITYKLYKRIPVNS